MKALILAGGIGSRLAPLTDNCPKSLVEVNGTPILIKQINNLQENGITDITIVVGYKAEMIKAAVTAQYPNVHFICNEEYLSTNNMYSAWLSRESIKGEDFLMMNADVFFDASVIAALLRCPIDNAIVTDIGRYMEESMKVVEKDGRLIQISKSISKENALGVSIDVYKFSAAGGNAFFAKCEEYILKNNERNMWTEVAINDIFADVNFGVCPLDGRWIEIDNLDDLDEAKRLFIN